MRDTWAKQEEAKDQTQNSQRQASQQPERPAIEVIKQLGKKYTNLPADKQLKSKTEIFELAKKVNYADLQPLFNTAPKKVGTRIATMLALGVLLENGLDRNEDIITFINNCKIDGNPLLNEASAKF